MPTPGESILLLGAQRLDEDWAKQTQSSQGQPAFLRIEEMDALAMATELQGLDVRAAVRVHGQGLTPVWNIGDEVKMEDGSILLVLKSPLTNPGSPFWKAYAQVQTQLDT